jgi:hypothetical protein
MNASSPMLCLVDEGNEEVIALRLLQRRLHLVPLYWHPTISLSISFQLKRPTRPIEEYSSLPTACICKLSFLIAVAFGIFFTGSKPFRMCLHHATNLVAGSPADARRLLFYPFGCMVNQRVALSQNDPKRTFDAYGVASAPFDLVRPGKLSISRPCGLYFGGALAPMSSYLCSDDRRPSETLTQTLAPAPRLPMTSAREYRRCNAWLQPRPLKIRPSISG